MRQEREFPGGTRNGNPTTEEGRGPPKTRHPGPTPTLPPLPTIGFGDDVFVDL